MRKKKILIIVSSVAAGGAQSLVLDYMSHLNSDKFEIFTISLRSGSMRDKFKAVGKNNYISLNLKRRFSFKTLSKISRFIRSNKIDIVHTHLIEADMYGFFIKLLCPGILLFSTRHGENKFRTSIQWGLVNFLFSIVNKRIICVSKSLANFMKRHEFLPNRKIELIYNGINVEYFKKEDHYNLRKKYESSEIEEILIGIVGRLKKLKGHDYLFRAISKLRDEKVINIKVLVIGEGKHLSNLIHLRDKLNLQEKIRFLGYKKSIKEYYNIFDILCLPSYYEGLPLVLCEAMACETLVLCSNIPNNLEVVEHNMDGIVFKKGSVKDLALKIKETITNEYDIITLKKNAREKVVRSFNFKTTIGNTENLYLKFLK